MRYTSEVRLFGIPVIEVRLADITTPWHPARAWIAIGDVAVGYLFAAGGVATGGIAIGGFATGIVPLGGLSVGVFALGGGAIGIWSVGGAAFAWQAALGGLAVAVNYALGGAAYAKHANDSAASLYFASSPFATVRAVLMYAKWLILLVLLIPALRRKKMMNRV